MCALQAHSQEAISFLESQGVDLSGVTQLGGHSRKRTHFNPKGPNVGFAIMKQLVAKLEQLPNVHLITSAKAMMQNPHRGLKFLMMHVPPRVGRRGGVDWLRQTEHWICQVGSFVQGAEGPFSLQVEEVMMEGRRVTGVKYVRVAREGEGGANGTSEPQFLHADAVILATGGYAANKDLLR
jgi:aspartate oxidase